MPNTKIKNSVNYILCEIRIRDPAIKWSIFPMMAIFFLPCLSLSLGRIKLPIATPAKNNDPNFPKTDFGAHTKSNL